MLPLARVTLSPGASPSGAWLGGTEKIRSSRPSYSPNGRHIAFMSTRGGLKQIYTIGRDGKGLSKVTSIGNNEMPSWSR